MTDRFLRKTVRAVNCGAAFTWAVPLGGFQVIPALRRSGRKTPHLVATCDLAGDGRDDWIDARSWTLESEPALFRIFADLVEADSICAFASKFGWLGVTEEAVLEDGSRVEAERLRSWKSAIRSLRNTIALWDAACTGHADEIVELFATEERYWKAAFENALKGAGAPLRTRGLDAAVSARHIERWPDVDADEKALFLIQAECNRRLERAPYSAVYVEDGVRPGCRARGSLVPRAAPRTLHDALWVQFVESMVGDRSYRRCAVCRTPFEVSRQGAPRNRVFCSAACKTKSTEQKERRAIKMRRAGRTIAEIRKETKSERETIRRWLAKAGLK